jgi:hypothetical protein
MTIRAMHASRWHWTKQQFERVKSRTERTDIRDRVKIAQKVEGAKINNEGEVLR